MLLGGRKLNIYCGLYLDEVPTTRVYFSIQHSKLINVRKKITPPYVCGPFFSWKPDCYTRNSLLTVHHAGGWWVLYPNITIKAKSYGNLPSRKEKEGEEEFGEKQDLTSCQSQSDKSLNHKMYTETTIQQCWIIVLVRSGDSRWPFGPNHTLPEPLANSEFYLSVMKMKNKHRTKCIPKH